MSSDVFSGLQAHVLSRGVELAGVRSAKDLVRGLHKRLLAAADQRLLAGGPQGVHGKIRQGEQKRGQELHIYGAGPRSERQNFDRDPSHPHFKRTDDAWFDFALTLREDRRGVILLSYSGELRFPAGDQWNGLSFLRWDMNGADHHNQQRFLRCHLHPGHEELLVPSPMLHPLELVEVLLTTRDLREP